MTNVEPPSETASAESSAEAEAVLCVDLDGTLIRSDLFFEGIFSLVRTQPTALPGLFMAFLNGRAAAKEYVAERITFDPSLLPYNEDLLAFIREEREKGRTIVLATASHQRMADRVAEHLQLFDRVLATEGSLNLKAERKAKRLKEEFETFDYIGDSQADLSVWECAKTGGVVSSHAGLIAQAREKCDVEKVFSDGVNPTAALRALRPHQWVKNLLLFLPPIMAHRFFEPGVLFTTLLSFGVFCATASTVYLLNDLCDLEADRHHPRKRNRPFANGSLRPQTGIAMVAVLLCLALLGSIFLPTGFLLVLALYFLLTTAYSFSLKQVVVLDIVLLAGLYTIRIIAGGAAAEIPVSKWLLGFSMFMFLSLACVKRFSELLAVRSKKQAAVHGRGYRPEDLEQLSIFGAASGYLSVLVLALYVSSPDVSALYTHPSVLWLLCPVVLYWISRIWILTRRGEVHEDPIVFALSDRVSYLIGTLSLLIIVFGM